jgi:tetratricopeptide (TPR) repeat protein
MKRLFNILVFCCLSLTAFSQEETRVVDSLLRVLDHQEGRDKVLTMIELTWEFYDISYDDCIDWGEKAINEAQNQCFKDLEADAMYALGMQYGYHGDLDLSQEKLREAFRLHEIVGNEARAFEDLWNQARFEQKNGNIDTSFQIYEKVLVYAEKRQDSIAMAQVYTNMAIIQHQKNDFVQAEKNLKKCFDIYNSIPDTVWVLRTETNMAGIYMEWGKYSEAKRLFLDAIPKMEAIGDYGILVSVYKNYGQLFVKQTMDFDSAKYYFEKAYSIVELLEENEIKVPITDKVNILVELGNSDYNQDNYLEAIEKYKEAFDLAESNAYYAGQLQACMGLGTAYSCLTKPSESLYYLNLFFELEEKSGITIAHSSMRLSLMLNYARLGKFDELESELSDFEEDYNGILRENVDIYDQLQDLQNELSDLFNEYDSQNTQIQTLQAQRNHYRLAFFGLLAIVLFMAVLFVAYKIVRKKRLKV